MLPPSELRARILAATRGTLPPTREHIRRRDRIWLLLALAAPLTVFFAFGGPRLAPRPPSLVVATTTSGLSIAAVAVALAIARGRSNVGRAPWLLLVVVLFTPAALFASKLGISSVLEGALRRWPERPGFRCLWLSLVSVLAPLACYLLARRGTVLEYAPLRGAAAGAALGAAVWVLVDLNCPVAYAPHLLLGHVLPLLASTVVGAGLGEPLLSLRAR
jgi:hypothetical protein